MASENRWTEYNAGTLTPPVVVQHDSFANGTHFLWVYTTMGGIRFFARESWDADVETALLALADQAGRPEYEITCEDGTVVQV